MLFLKGLQEQLLRIGVGMMAQVCNASTQEAKVTGLRVQGQFGLHRMFEADQDYLERSCLNKQTKNELRSRLQIATLRLNAEE